VLILNKLDDQASLLCPYFSAGIIVTAAYWGAASYGAITVMQVYYLSQYIYLDTIYS